MLSGYGDVRVHEVGYPIASPGEEVKGFSQISIAMKDIMEGE